MPRASSLGGPTSDLTTDFPGRRHSREGRLSCKKRGDTTSVSGKPPWPLNSLGLRPLFITGHTTHPGNSDVKETGRSWDGHPLGRWDKGDPGQRSKFPHNLDTLMRFYCPRSHFGSPTASREIHGMLIHVQPVLDDMQSSRLDKFVALTNSAP